MKILLTESIHPVAVSNLKSDGFDVELLSGALEEEDLVRRIADVDMIGIRSKTRITPRALEAAARLRAVGCFCIGTNQVDLDAAKKRGVPVFNAPFSNTRSVAELIIAEIVMLARQLGDRSMALHRGEWRKSASGSHEIRGKTLGIVGYGHIGSQTGVLAEAMGMRVVFYDIVSRLPMGNNRSAASLEELLRESDFVTLHVPATPQTHMMIGKAELDLMKPGAFLLNASRGTVVDLDALAAKLESGQLGGAAIDVYPVEPRSNGGGFQSPLLGKPNVVLSPHIGGSTEEAQESIGNEVSAVLSKYARTGGTQGAVNFPNVELMLKEGLCRIANIHKNVPGVMRDINRILSERDANIHAQSLATDEEIGYLLTDIDHDVSDDVVSAIKALPTSIRTRKLA